MQNLNLTKSLKYWHLNVTSVACTLKHLGEILVYLLPLSVTDTISFARFGIGGMEEEIENWGSELNTIEVQGVPKKMFPCLRGYNSDKNGTTIKSKMSLKSTCNSLSDGH